MNLNFEKYKRVFAFGCSFTSYDYPTWADIVASEMPESEFFNLGKKGGGNLFIASRVAEANARYKFCDTDLIMVMYTTSFREDRHLNGSWQTFGNIYNQQHYPMDSFVIPYCQPTGMLIRDLSIIEMSVGYIKSLPCDNLLLKAGNLFDDHDMTAHKDNESAVVELYSSLLNSFPASMREIEFPNGFEVGAVYLSKGKIFKDIHPLPVRYYNYLIKIGLNLTDLSEKYVKEVMAKFDNCKKWVDFRIEYPDCAKQIAQTKVSMF